MNSPKTNEQLRLLRQEVALTGEAVDALRRDHRAAIDGLRLEMEVLRRCLMLAHPEFAECYEALRQQILRETDPETS